MLCKKQEYSQSDCIWLHWPVMSLTAVPQVFHGDIWVHQLVWLNEWKWWNNNLNPWRNPAISRYPPLPSPPPHTCVLFSRTWPPSALDVSVLAALRSCRHEKEATASDTLQKDASYFILLHSKVFRPYGFHAIALCVTAWLPRALLLSHNEHRTAELCCLRISRPLSPLVASSHGNIW